MDDIRNIIDKIDDISNIIDKMDDISNIIENMDDIGNIIAYNQYNTFHWWFATEKYRQLHIHTEMLYLETWHLAYTYSITTWNKDMEN